MGKTSNPEQLCVPDIKLDVALSIASISLLYNTENRGHFLALMRSELTLCRDRY